MSQVEFQGLHENTQKQFDPWENRNSCENSILFYIKTKERHNINTSLNKRASQACDMIFSALGMLMNAGVRLCYLAAQVMGTRWAA